MEALPTRLPVRYAQRDDNRLVVGSGMWSGQLAKRRNSVARVASGVVGLGASTMEWELPLLFHLFLRENLAIRRAHLGQYRAASHRHHPSRDYRVSYNAAPAVTGPTSL